MFELIGNIPPIDKPLLTPVSVDAANLLSTHVEVLDDRYRRIDIDTQKLLDRGDMLHDTMNTFQALCNVPTELEETFEEGFTLAYNLLAKQASTNKINLPEITEATTKLYFRQLTYNYDDVDDFYTIKTDCIEKNDEFGHNALQSYLDYYTNELNGSHRCAIVFGFAALFDILEYHSTLESTTDIHTRKN